MRRSWKETASHTRRARHNRKIIEGIIRKGGKLLVAGASKAGKSYLLIELAIAVATGGWWLDFRCAKGRVLYVNLEIQKPQFMHRVYNVAKAVGVSRTTVHENMMVANLRGKYSDITSLVDDLINSYEPGVFDLVIIDPAYKVQPGSENDADAITRFCAELDRLVEAIDCTIAYSHHHSKGSQGGKNAQDRASGSGVFGRDGPRSCGIAMAPFLSAWNSSCETSSPLNRSTSGSSIPSMRWTIRTRWEAARYANQGEREALGTAAVMRRGAKWKPP